MEDIKKLVKKRIGAPELDSVSFRKSTLHDRKIDKGLVDYCKRIHDNMEEVREQRARGYRMTFGDQWSDMITVYDAKGNAETMSMRTYMEREGAIVLQANQIKPMLNTILGVLVKEQNEPICNARDRKEQQYGEVMTATLQANCNKNKMDSIYKLCTTDYLIGGIGCIKERYGNLDGREDSWSEYINPNYLILDIGMRDPRFWDAQLIGTWYEMPKAALIKQFVKKRGDMDMLAKVYGTSFLDRDVAPGMELVDQQDLRNITFMQPVDPGKCAVLEVWTKEIKERVRLHDYSEGSIDVVDADDKEALAKVDQINKDRKSLARLAGWLDDEIPYIEKEYFIDEYWYARWLAPDGTILDEMESPYPGRQHPFTIMITPFADGRICGYFTDAYDLQQVMNRSLVLYDWAIRNQVKGLTIVPKDAIPTDVSNQDFVSSMRIDNVVIYDSKKSGGLKPEIFHGASTTVDAANMMNTVKNLMESSLSVSGAMQGKTPYSGTSAAMYAQMTANSSTPIMAVLKDVRTFMEESAIKKMKNISRWYEPERYESIVGSIDGIFDNENLNLHDVGHIEYDLSIKEGTETPVYRQTANDFLIQLLQMGAVTPEEALEHGYFPFADKLLQDRQARQAEMEAAQEGQMGAEAQQSALSATGAQQMVEDFGTPENGNVIHSTRPIVQ